MKRTFKKEEKLKSKKLISTLFTEGKSLNKYPINLVYLQIDHDASTLLKAGVSVSKRRFSNAVDRNRIKRLMREAYRKNKHIINDSEHTKKHIFMFIYVGKKEEKYAFLEKSMEDLLNKFLSKNQIN